MRETGRISANELNRACSRDDGAVSRLLTEEIGKSQGKIVVLDDDPTGVQTVHGVSVYTDWSRESVLRGFEEENRLFYILTNSRGFTVEETRRAHREIAGNIAWAARMTGREFVIVSRSDSTLRGHYPLETEVLRQTLEEEEHWHVDGEVICPFFLEGGRFTLDNVHYVRCGGELVPAGQTEFAADRTFGYRSSDLRDYVEEKTGGAYPAESVSCIPLEYLRSGAVDQITGILLAVKDFGKVVVNAVDYGDLRVFCLALYRAMAQGRSFMFRTAASFVKVFGGIKDRPLLAGSELLDGRTGRGGVIVVGSHTEKTTRQLAELQKVPGITFLEFNSDLVLDPEAFREEIGRTVREMERRVAAGQTVAVFTRRTLLEIPGDTPEAALLRSVKISDAVQSLVASLKTAPAYVVAKGGITSSDVGVKALQVKRADVLGQIRPGVPVWRTGPESRFPGIPYVIFPGNVGEDGTLREAVEILLAAGNGGESRDL
ncbi:four-carbon acid sugar kinase family protein [Enterocloster lavalensis]|uniref:four-carbon acid sugar kinase family protein n=1 Tax=Enterocloster lavalensis TaxID=460384 RepID=UPI001D0681C7|nr:four-carbon acid sugar kinase family protein [Enterocloster lavalensis]MCB6343889.1 hydroxyacid dehydrogenase [Enterocloster lavalensis]